MKRQFILPDPVSGLNGANAGNLYNKGTGYLNKYLKLDTSGFDKIGNLLNGDMAGYMGKSAEEFFGQEAGLVVESAIDILMSWQKGKDSKEAAQDASQVAQIGAAVKANADAGVAAVSDINNQLNAGYQEALDQVQTGSQDVFDAVNQMNTNNENVVSENEALNEDIKALEEEKQKIQDEILQLETEKFEKEEQQQNFEAILQEKNGPLQEEFNNLSEEDKMGPKGQELQNQINSNIAEYQPQIEALGVEISGIEALVTQKNNEMLDIDANIEELIAKITENVEESEQENEETVTLTQDQLDNIDQATNEIVSMYGNSQQAYDQVKNMLEGNFAKMDDATLIKMAREMIKAGINGTESGILSAAATAAGVGSVFSFGASSGLAVKYATAAADKGVGAGSRIAANAGMKIVENEFKNYMSQMINQTITMTLGSEMASLYNDTVSTMNDAKSLISDLGVGDDSTKPKDTANSTA